MASSYLFQQEVFHSGLNKYKVVKANSRYELNQRVAILQAQWAEQWSKKCALEDKRREREARLKSDEDSVLYAEEMTQEAERVQNSLDTILLDSLKQDVFDINKLKDFSKFTVEQPIEPKKEWIPYEPELTLSKYNPKEPFSAKIFKKKKEEFKKQNMELFKQDWDNWDTNRKRIETDYANAMNEYIKKIDQWNSQKDMFYKNRDEINSQYDEIKQKFDAADANSINEYYTLVLNDMVIPLDYDRQIDLDYSTNNKMMIIDMFLPILDDIPKLKKISFIKSKGEFKESRHTDAYLKKKYDSVIYQIVLQTINTVFINDSEHDYIQNIVLNGKNSTIDKTTGKRIEPYVLSINITKSDFLDLNLSAIDPKAWFRKAKGISAANLAEVTPVAPIVTINKEDSRFIEGYEVIDKMDSSINLAAIDWKDFENLVRELFEQEFSSNGGEVKITQASRDGGVDAVAFDPDPIRGGKIVIQAKRYTNVVGVSAVRDLYGTIMNEGAIKGILVTTSNYGNDAYNFAKGKPITLMNGANLLEMLDRHGHKMRIDLEEAKRILNG